MEIKTLENYQLYLSGNYGAKIAKTFKNFKKENQSTTLTYKKILELNDGAIIYITDENLLDFYEPSLDNFYQNKYMEKINNYIRKTIYKVEDEKLRDKIIDIANLDLSRNSKYHIFNIEILVTCVLRKPDYFFFIHTLAKEKYLYFEEKEHYEFLIFSVYDAETKEKANMIYETIMENSCNICSYHTKYKLYALKAVANAINSDEVQKVVESNLELIKI